MLGIAGEDTTGLFGEMDEKILEGLCRRHGRVKIIDTQMHTADITVRSACRGRRRRWTGMTREGEQGEAEQTDVDDGEQGETAQTGACKLVAADVVPVEVNIAEQLSLLDDGLLQVSLRMLVVAGQGQGLAARIADAEAAQGGVKEGQAEHLQPDQIVPEQGRRCRRCQRRGTMLHLSARLFLRGMGEKSEKDGKLKQQCCTECQQGTQNQSS